MMMRRRNMKRKRRKTIRKWRNTIRKWSSTTAKRMNPMQRKHKMSTATRWKMMIFEEGKERTLPKTSNYSQ